MNTLLKRMKAATEAIDSYVQRSLAERGMPGLALAITSRETLLYEGYYGYADLKLKTPVTDATLFQIGSITKSFTAIALMQLVDEGALQLEAPLGTYLPWFSIQSAHEPIRVHHLLTHSAGIPANRDDVPGSLFTAYALRDQRAAWPPGERFHYSNVGYQVLHVLLERLRGEAYADIIQERIFGPLGMRRSRPAIRLDSRQTQAVGYIAPFDNRLWHASHGRVEAPFFEYGIGDGCIQCTASELATYVVMLLRGGSPLISAKAFEQFTTPHVPMSDDVSEGYYAYGLEVKEEAGRRVLSHSGGMVGFSAWAAADATHDLGVAVLANALTDVQHVGDYSMQVVRAALAGVEFPPAPETRDAFKTEKAADYAQSYAAPAGDGLRFRAEGDRLLLVAPSGQRVMLGTRGEDAFYTPHPDYDGYGFRFARNDSGEVIEVFHGPRWYASQDYDGPTTFDVPAEWRAYIGRYRSYSPWIPYFEVFARKGHLMVFTPHEDNVPDSEQVLTETAPGIFRIGPDPSPEVIHFGDVVDGQALRAVWSGHPFFRTSL
jgi:D-alanyl-D-alanine carboxypeptidase